MAPWVVMINSSVFCHHCNDLRVDFEVKIKLKGHTVLKMMIEDGVLKAQNKSEISRATDAVFGLY